MIKIKAAIKIYMNPDLMMRSVRVFEERVAERGLTSLVKLCGGVGNGFDPRAC